MFGKKTLPLLLLALAGTVLFAAKPDPKALVAKVGDRSYTYKAFNDGFKAYLQYHTKGKTLTQQDSVRYNNQYWEELVGIYVYDQAIKAGRIKVSNAELEAEIKRNVPDGVKSIKDFQTNGKFDQKKYEQGLKDHPDFKKEVMGYTRDLYSYNKLIEAIKNEVTPNPDSVKANWTKQQNKAEASIICFDYSKRTDITITEAEAQAYYDEHKDEFKRENGRGYLLVRFKGALSKTEDSENILKENKNKSAALYSRAKEIGLAKAAAEMNLEVEESPLFNNQDEIIPLIGRAPNLVSFAYANAIGSIPEVFYAPTGDILVLELNREAPEYYIDYEIKKQEINIRATRSKRMWTMDQYMQDFVKNIKPEAYLEAARKDSLVIVQVTDVLIDNEIKPLGKIPSLNKAILDTPEGNWTNTLEQDKKWYLALVTKRQFPDLNIWEKDKKKLLEAAKKEMQQEHLNQWYLEQRKKVEIIDNRHEYYPIRQMIKL
jgi:hypothetical protein